MCFLNLSTVCIPPQKGNKPILTPHSRLLLRRRRFLQNSTLVFLVHDFELLVNIKGFVVKVLRGFLTFAGGCKVGGGGEWSSFFFGNVCLCVFGSEDQ